MSRYIDSDVLLNTVFEVHCKECDKRKGEKNGKYKTIYEVGEAPCKSCGVNDMREYIEDAPTADVVPMDFHNKVLEIEIKKQENLVEVVRCKDCTRQMICFHSDDYFCADGERRGDGN